MDIKPRAGNADRRFNEIEFVRGERIIGAAFESDDAAKLLTMGDRNGSNGVSLRREGMCFVETGYAQRSVRGSGPDPVS